MHVQVEMRPRDLKRDLKGCMKRNRLYFRLRFAFPVLCLLAGCDTGPADTFPGISTDTVTDSEREQPAVRTAQQSEEKSATALIDFSELDRFLALHSKLFRHVAFLIRKDGAVVYRYGEIDTPIVAASCSKWLGAAAIMKLVETGTLNLDAPAATYLKNAPHRVGTLTLRELLSHTAGLRPSKPGEVAYFTDPPLRRTLYNRLHFRKEKAPAFCYSNIGFNFAGEIASTAVHRNWAAVFQDEIALPLGMTHTWFPTRAPALAGGAHVSAADYSRFLEMFRHGGVSMEGRRVLKEETVSEMLKDQTHGLPLECNSRPSKRKESYGLGLWRQGKGEWPQLASHFGSDGYKVFLDFCRDLSAVFITEFKESKKKEGRDLTWSLYDIVERAIPINASCAGSLELENNHWIPPMRPPTNDGNSPPAPAPGAPDAS